MRIVHKGEFPGTRADLEAEVAAYRQALVDHAQTVAVPAPWPEYEVLRELVHLPDDQWILADDIPDDADPPPTVTYREKRAADFRDELGTEAGSYIVTLGDVVDVMIKEQRARGEPVSAEFATMVAKIDEIKARHPKP